MQRLQILFIVLMALFLANCSTITETSPRRSSSILSPYTLPASAYLAMAKKQTGEAQQELLIMAAGRFLQDGAWQQGSTILKQVSPVSTETADEKRILQAKIFLVRGQTQMVLTTLGQVKALQQLTDYYQAEYHDILAQTYQKQNNLILSVSERIKIEPLLPDEATRQNNRRALWLSLSHLPIEELETLTLETPQGSVVQGWLKLATISRKYHLRPQMMLTQLELWEEAYPGHPGMSLLPYSLEEMRLHLYPPPKKVALLLPLTGVLAGPGTAIKEGFLAAFEASGASNFMRIRFYDTNALAIATLYEQACAEGAELIIGPLTKSDVATVATLEHPVPTILLNDVHQTLPPDTFQFGLSPLLEAKQVAARARKDGYARALIIRLDNAWGEEVVRAFQDQWTSSGGEVVDVLSYQAQDNLNQRIRGILHIDASEQRARQVKQLLGRSIDSIPHRRQDFDVIFLVAYPSTARQIKPLLNYYYAGDVPVYATSSVYAGNLSTMRDRDLNGIIFCDLPWVFTHNMGDKNWPEQFNSYGRLYALGVDSFTLATTLNELLLFPAINNENGILYLNTNHQISRILAFGQFREGRPERLPD
jgi:uncharacterized protein